MSNYIEYDDRIAFHPGYYIKEMLDNSIRTISRKGDVYENIICI